MQLLNRGAFADVYDLGDGTIAKIFRRTSHTHSRVRDWDDHEFITKRLFATELRAYELLQGEPGLHPFTPRFYGAFDTSTLALPRSSTGQPYVVGCALRLELIPGRDIKIALVPMPLQREIEQIVEGIRDVVRGVNVWDCSCFVPGPRTPFVVVDFALWDDMSDVEVFLDENGTIPPDMRARLRIV